MKVDIFGSDYNIKGDIDPEHLKNISDYLDVKMKEISKKTTTISSLKVAILASLNITDELFSLRHDSISAKNEIDKKSKILMDMIDKELKR